MPILCRTVTRHRRHPLLRWIERKCRRFIDCIENAHNYDFDSNGEAHLLRQLASPESRVVFDVGANVGDWARMARRAMPAAAIHCFEVMPTTAAELRSRNGGDPGIRINEFGLSNAAGTVTLRSFEGLSPLTSLVALDHKLPFVEVEGRVVTGDAYCAEQSVAHIDLLKIDVEAAEWMVMQGLQGLLARRAVDVIQFEYGRGSIFSHFLLRDYHLLLQAHGYRVGKLYADHVEFRDYDPAHEDFLGPNFVAVRADRQELMALLS
jgi:FkbM family methyltransferase